MIEASSALGAVTTLQVPLRPATTPPTFYARHGDWLVVVLAAGLAALLAIQPLRGRRRGLVAPPSNAP